MIMNIAASFVIGYSLPFVFWAVIATFSLSNTKGIAFGWGVAAVILGVGFVGSYRGRMLRSHFTK
jgi:hypothetical protein